jgi:hypothetical protein
VGDPRVRPKPPAIPEWARLKEARMNKLSPELVRHVLRPAMHQKLLLRAAELVEQGWTRGTAARDAAGQKVRSISPQATAWCVVGARWIAHCTSC